MQRGLEVSIYLHIRSAVWRDLLIDYRTARIPDPAYYKTSKCWGVGYAEDVYGDVEKVST